MSPPEQESDKATLSRPLPAPGVPAVAEAVLLERLRSGEEEAFEMLVRRQGAHLLDVARCLLDTEEEARDALEEAFLAASQALPRFRGESSLSTWLRQIVVRTALTRPRRAQRRSDRPIAELLPRFDGDGHHLHPVAPWDPARCAAETTVSGGAARRTVQACVAALPPAHRAALVLRDVEGCSTAEVARALALDAGEVEALVHQARLALRTLLAPHFEQRPSGPGAARA